MVSSVAQIEPLIRFAREKNSWGNPTLFVEVCRLISSVQHRLSPEATSSILEFLEMAGPRVGDAALEQGAELLAKHTTLNASIKDWCLCEAPEAMLVVLIKGEIELEDADYPKISDRATPTIYAALGSRDVLPLAVLNCLSARLTGDPMRIFLEKHIDRMPAEACTILRRRAEFVKEIDVQRLPK